MKKIRRLSLYKSKKIQENDNCNEELNESSERSTKSPAKSPFGKSLKKKFFSSKSLQRSQSTSDDNRDKDLTSSQPIKQEATVPELSPDETHVKLVGSPSRKINSNLYMIDHGDHPQATTNNHAVQTEVPALANGTHTYLSADSSAGDGGNCSKKDAQTETENGVLEDSDRATTSNGGIPAMKESRQLYINQSALDANKPVISENNDLNHESYAASFENPLSPTINHDLHSLTNPIVPRNIPRHTITTEFKRLAQQGWYWGPLTRIEAEQKLHDMPDGSFLVRDSSDERYLLSLSFRSFGRTLHTRIEHSTGKFSFYANCCTQTYTSVVDLIEDSVRDSQGTGVFCYSRSRSPQSPTLPVWLTFPVSRLSQVRSLQYLCRFVIRQYTRIDHIEKLPLPVPVKGYLNQSYF